MDPDLVKSTTLTEFFQGQVERALTHQRLGALDLTRYYLVQLLAGRARSEAPRGEEPLALWYGRALETGGSRQRAELRGLADHALFVAGFFSDSLMRKLVDVDYYASLGRCAYQHLSQFPSDSFAPAYAELSERFLAFADVLTEVSEQGGTTDARDLLRLYERWLANGSSRNAQRLARLGVTPAVAARVARHRVQ
ncbi:MAG: hypothetical protein AB7I50_14770 [Vicinamibacterales bacterium]